ncbi:hypothetical protein EVAR_5261_1 [Eumeta japonica]|uniref:ATP-dependent DNA helicase n=1 Tax=Eumeta variegata TaxID=151549 RepID=A0A4C1XSC1_EUMVA|nr:hypothetical protein EVAR_5261_1 [Eumeta japonica]
MPVAMRSLFIQILIYGSPENPKRLWDTFKENLSEDFIHAARRNGQSVNSAINRAYRIIAHKLNTEATEGRNFQYWVRTFGFEDIGDYDIEINQSTVNADESAVLGANVSATKRKAGIASILLPHGRTSHKIFGLRVPLTPDSASSIKPNSSKARQLAEIDIFLMDEAPMLPKYGLQNIDQLLRSVGNPDLPFGGKVMTFTLEENMHIQIDQQQFAKYLLKLGNGELPLNNMDEIELPLSVISTGNLIDEVFGNCLVSENYDGMKDRAILAPLNKDVDKINNDIVAKLPGEYKIYYSNDSVKDQHEGALEFTTEFLNSVNISDLPPHELK